MAHTFVTTHNPLLLPRYHVPDGEAHVMPDGNLYIYGSYDDCEVAYCSDTYHVVSTPDMKTWSVHDPAMKGSDVPFFRRELAGNVYGTEEPPVTPFILKMRAAVEAEPEKDFFGDLAERERDALLYAPDAAHKDGKYYLYFCMEDGSEGVGISDRPEGPFSDFKQLPAQGIDPAVLVESDGQAYYFWGQFSARGVPLNPDMVSYDPVKVVNGVLTEEEHHFHEGFSVRRIGDTYYAVYSEISRGRPTALGYATSKHPLGPYTYRGVIIDNEGCDPESWNDHGSIECFHGQWYVFYHRSTRGTKIHRRLCAEKIEILPDGTIPEVKMTSQGPGAPFGVRETLWAHQACGLRGTCRIDLDERGHDVIAQVSDGDEAWFRYVNLNSENTLLGLQFAGSAVVEVWLDDDMIGSAQVDGRHPAIQLSHGQCKNAEVRLVFRHPESFVIHSFRFEGDGRA